MEEQQLEKVMVEFLNRAYDILVCTTIIESGLDYPQANTIFINRADKFGLAQLYQLRGRVGRSAAQAYAYLIIPAQSLLTRDAQKRLHALMQLTELGSGFQLAAQDLEIRGAGNILGTAQSGHIRALGYDLYMDLLAKAVAELKGEEIVEEVEPVISLGISAYVPEEYVPDVNTRLVLYKRLAASGRQDELEDLKQEMTDRFGPLPELVITLAKVMGLRQRLKLLSANAAKRQGEKVRVEFSDDASVSLDDILTLQKRWSDIISLCPDRSFMVSVAGVKEEELLARLDAVLASLAKICQRSSS
jgi:transcription-repair coupling factor (superfamily II helicase)